MVKIKTCVFISGTGTNLRKLIQSSRSYNFPININLVICNKIDAEGLKLAKKFNISYMIFNKDKSFSEIKILNELKKRKIRLICLAGYMRILSSKFINGFSGKIINIHPSLLPKFKGINTFSKVIKNKEKKTGCTVHYVNEHLDSGKIILKKSFSISSKDNEKSLKKKTQNLEYRAFSEAIFKVIRNF